MLRNIILVSVRNLMRNPGTSVLNVVGLVAGFTCLLLTIMWVGTELSFDRFHHSPDNLYKVMTHVESDGSFTTFDAAAANIDVTSIPEVESVVTVATGNRWPNELCFRKEGNESDCVYLNGIFATEPFFSTFNFPVASGEDQPLTQPASIAISEKMATLLYGSSDPIGKIIKVDNHFPVTVTAIFKDVPANSSLQFQFVLNMKVFASMRGLTPDFYANQFFQTYIRTNKTVDTKELTAKLNDPRVLTEKLKADKLKYEAFPLEKWRLKNKFEGGKNTGGRIEYVRIFLVVTALVVILAIINFINVSTARATIRAKEIGIRKVTGAIRSNIISQFIGESFMIVLLSFVIAGIITQISLPSLASVFGVPITTGMFEGWQPLYLIGLLVVVAIVAGSYPAFVMASFQPIKVLKNQISGLHGSNRLRKILLVVQVSISLGILSFSGVLFLQLNYLSEKDLGIDHQNIIHVEPTYRMLQKYDAFKNELMKDKSILQVSASSANPIDLDGQTTGVKWQGKPDDQRVTMQVMGCSYEFLETFNLKVIEGRNFLLKSQDTVNTEIIVTQDAIDVMGLKDPIGTIIHIGDAACSIVGVINNFHTRPLHEERLPVILYQNQHLNLSYVFVKYESGKTAEAMKAVQQAYNTVEPSFTMKYWFQDERFDEQYKTEKNASVLISFFGTIALIIACIGIVGLSTFNVLRRLKELSIRKVFGASGIQLLALLTKEFGWIFVIAVPTGIALVWYAANEWLSGFAYHVSMPWWLFITCAAILCMLTIGIVTVQGLKAVVSNPTKILRND